MSLTVQTFFDSFIAGEVAKRTTDFGEFIPAGASIPSAGNTSASYQQTFGGSLSGSCATSVAGGSLVTHTIPAAASLTGQYTFSVAASLSDGQVRKALWYETVHA